MAMNLWETLLRPDQEERQDPGRAIVTRAANLLQVGEFQVLQLAYKEWHDEELPEPLTDRLFHAYMIHGEVPYWARHYAGQILRLDEHGRLNDNDPRYHRYDHDYRTRVPGGLLKFCLAVAGLVLFVGGGIVLANLTVNNPASLFPPYLEEEDLPGGKPSDGRTDGADPSRDSELHWKFRPYVRTGGPLG